MSSIEGFKSLTSIEEVLREAGNLLTHKPSMIKVHIGEALGRYLAEDIIAPFNLPPHNRSVVDGYAVRSKDTFGASPSNPVILKVKGFVRVGENLGLEVGEGEAVELSTGAPMPKGADSVVMYEKARRVGDFIEVLEPVPPMANVSRVGEDVREGERILARGVRLAPWDIAVLASLGYKSVRVYNVNVALISTGSELVELENVEDARGALESGLVINSNRYSMEGLLRDNGFNPHYLGIVPDDFEAIRNVIIKALESYDAVITMGGASVGKPDYTVKAVKSLNPDYLAHGILMRPGRANSLAVVGGKPVFMLSGFPVASIVGFEAIAKPLLLRMVGGVEEPKPLVKGVLTRRVNTPINVRSYVRVKVYRRNGEVYVEPLALTGSGILSTLVRGNGILIVPENREGYDEGDVVEVILLRSIE